MVAKRPIINSVVFFNVFWFLPNLGLGVRVHIFVLGHHLGFSNCGGLRSGNIRRGIRG